MVVGKVAVEQENCMKIFTELGRQQNMISEDTESQNGADTRKENEEKSDARQEHHLTLPPHPGIRVLTPGSIISHAGPMNTAETLHSMGMSGHHGGSTMLQYSGVDGGGGGPFFIPATMPVSESNSGFGSSGTEDGNSGSKKREIRLLKNREAARECRRKKKEYIKCLENRVAVLENQNKALIEELKSLKELYTGGKTM